MPSGIPLFGSNSQINARIYRLVQDDPRKTGALPRRQAGLLRTGRLGGSMGNPSIKGRSGALTLYALKPRFQAALRPVVGLFASHAVTASQVTAFRLGISLALGFLILLSDASRPLFLLIPLWQVIRMALNTIDGMLAREFCQKSALGAYVNELGDVLSDMSLYLPFGLIAPFSPTEMLTIIFLAALSEFAGVLGSAVSASRRYDGPFGKSDRAFLFGMLGLWIGIGGALPNWSFGMVPLVSALLLWTTVNRVRLGLEEIRQRRQSNSSEAFLDRGHREVIHASA